MMTGTVANKVSLLARYVSTVKKSESSRKELSGFFVFIWMQSSWKKNEVSQTWATPDTNLATVPVTNGIWIVKNNCVKWCSYNFWTICPEVEKNQLLSFARRTILLQILWSKCYIVQEIVLFINERQLCLANQIFMQAWNLSRFSMMREL